MSEDKLDLSYALAIEAVSRRAKDEFDRTLARLLVGCESPIERMMAHQLAALPSIEAVMQGRGLDAYLYDQDFPPGYQLPFKDRIRGDLIIVGQASIDRWRADFLIQFMDLAGNVCSIVVECDGHDFHERTKEQAARDRSRDRDMAARGIVVLRFTGSEIYRDPSLCGCEVYNLIRNMYEGIREAANG